MKKNFLIRIIWWVYIVLLLVVVIMKFRGSFSELIARIESTSPGTNYNIIPFSSIGEQLNHLSEGWARYNLLGNIIPFIPFGLLLPLISNKATSFANVVSVGFLFILCIELFQLITRLGSFDVDDIILNLFGVIIGYIVMLFVNTTRDRKQ